MSYDIENILIRLKKNKTDRTKKNLEKLNAILKSYVETGQRDFSITQIGRISLANGGLGYEALRATRNEHYRILIEAWAKICNTTTKKPPSLTSRSKSIPKDNILLERIPDFAVRALFGQIVAERNRYRKEVNLLKQQTNIVIDKRPLCMSNKGQQDYIETLPFTSRNLTESERKALSYAISAECLENNGWQATEAGQVKDSIYNSEVFPRGFITGLRKLLNQI